MRRCFTRISVALPAAVLLAGLWIGAGAQTYQRRQSVSRQSSIQQSEVVGVEHQVTPYAPSYQTVPRSPSSTWYDLSGRSTGRSGPEEWRSRAGDARSALRRGADPQSDPRRLSNQDDPDSLRRAYGPFGSPSGDRTWRMIREDDAVNHRTSRGGIGDRDGQDRGWYGDSGRREAYGWSYYYGPSSYAQYRLYYGSPYRYRSYYSCPWYTTYYYPSHPHWGQAVRYGSNFAVGFSYDPSRKRNLRVSFSYGYGAGIRLGSLSAMYTWYPYGGYQQVPIGDLP